MFRRHLYIGWLLAALLFWGAAWYSDRIFHRERQPKSVAATVQQRLWDQDARIRSLAHDTLRLARLFANRIDDALFKELANSRFYLFAYDNDSLYFWNREDITPPVRPEQDTLGHLVSINNQYCICKVFVYPQPGGGDKRLAFLQTISFQYPLTNEYLHSYLAALPSLKADISIYEEPSDGAVDIRGPDRHYWFSMEVTPDDNDSPVPSTTTVVLFLVAVLLSCISLQWLILVLTRRKGWRRGVLATILCVVALKLGMIYGTLPFHLKELGIFSPDVYAASKLLPSLGDLLFNEICLIWLLVFVLTETPYKTYLKNLTNPVARGMIGIGLLLLLLFINNEIWGILHSLVIDSQIIFNVAHLHSANEYTLAGLVAIVAGLLITEMSVRLINAQLRQVLGHRYLRQAIILGVGLMVFRLTYTPKELQCFNMVWLCGYIFLLDLTQTRTFANTLSLPVIFLSLFTCACTTVKLHYLIRLRDLDKDRIAYAAHLLAQQDPQMEYTFKGVKGSLRKDGMIHSFFEAPSEARQAELVKRLNVIHLDVILSRYQTSYYFFDSTEQPLFNADTSGYKTLLARYESGIPTLDGSLMFTEQDGQSGYLSRIVFEESGRLLGSMFLSITPRKTVHETVYPELLQPSTVSRVDREGRYDYALYAGGRLITQTSDYTFPQRIDSNIRPGAVIVRKPGNVFELFYSEAPGKAVIVAGRSESWLGTGILMSYLFVLHLLFSLIAVGYQWFFRIVLGDKLPGYSFTLGRRIHFSMQSVVLLSFLIIGVVTIIFFENKYDSARKTADYQTTQTINRFAHQYLAGLGGLRSVQAMDSVVQSAEFQYAMANVAANQKTDANIFSTGGKLLLATQEGIYNEGLLAPVMHPAAFRQLKSGSPIAEVEEAVGHFYFISCYAPIKNEDGVTLGYISVPFFSSEKELSDQISNIIIALINIYALLFLLSSLLGLIITSRLTRTFNLLISKFEQLSLHKNELIEWPYDDEIGKLVKEYNNMARKVEENATLLAQSEREGAWREMAKQVAHEIKNPLTPMKLNIQYLQNALRNKHPDVESLAARVSNSIIEQIDNLSYIASEFSNFAKLPEANPELVCISELLENAVALYQNKDGVEVSYKNIGRRLKVIADKSQLLRVFTNLLQNAVQAIPVDEREGLIDVRLQQENDGTALISVTDNGAGIPDEVAERIFKPYFTTKSSGTGLGLAMTRKIIELWKGTIWFTSVEGEGTTFFVRLPVAETEDDHQT